VKAKINNTLIKKLLPEDKEYEVHDTDLKGFVIRVFPSGTMRYICQYQRGRKINIGTVGVITPAQAREKAVEILSDFNKEVSKAYDGEKVRLSLKQLGDLLFVNVLVVIFGLIFRFKYRFTINDNDAKLRRIAEDSSA